MGIDLEVRREEGDIFGMTCVFLNLHQQIQIANIQFNDMKKNMSCKGIRTNITSPTNTFRQTPKRQFNLDLLSYKNHPPKVQFPASTKSPPEQPLRKKIFSSHKQLPKSNENVSQVNINAPTTPLGESNRAYDQLKRRLVEIKKNFELSFQKRTEKSRIGKENSEPFRQKQKSKLVLAKQQEKFEKQKGEKKDGSRGRDTSKTKQPGLQRATVQLKGEKTDNILQDYVTTFTCQSPTMLTHCVSDANLFKPNKFTKENKALQRYYIDAVIGAFSASRPTTFEQLCKTHLTTSIEILQFIKNSNKGMPQAPNARPLPPTSKPTLIFDLDQTLIHCNENANMPCDVLLPIRFPNGAMVKAGINIRPYARQCLEQLARDFELIVFTASHECYANVIIDYIDQKRLISHRFFRDSCWRSEEGFYVKDLRVIDRDLKNVLLIDNAAYSYCFHLDNGVPIVPFYDNKADLQLKSLVGYVRSLGLQANLRQKNSTTMRLREYPGISDARQLLRRLYGCQN